MRVPVMLACALALVPAASGCLGDIDLGDGIGADYDCSSDTDTIAQQRSDMLVPPQTPSQVPDQNPRVAVTAREGQTVVAQAVFTVAAGELQVVYDGPPGMVTTQAAGVTWSSIAQDVPAGNVTLALAGDPFAFGVEYTISLTASGCTPA